MSNVGYINVARCGSSKPGPHEPSMAEVWANAEGIVALRNSASWLLGKAREAIEAQEGKK